MTKAEKREAEVMKLTRRLMRRFDGRYHRFLIDFGWEQVARVVLGETVRLTSSGPTPAWLGTKRVGDVVRVKTSKPLRPSK